jgi:hypothetical protein
MQDASLQSSSSSSSSSIFDLESVWIWECGVEGRCLQRPGGRQTAALQRFEDEDEFENETSELVRQCFFLELLTGVGVG